jgi:hypothetical protein
MLHVGRNALTDPAKVVRSAQFVQEEVRNTHWSHSPAPHCWEGFWSLL